MLLKPFLALHIMNFSSCRNYWGGKTICFPPPPQYFHWGGGGGRLPPPPRIDASVAQGVIVLDLMTVQAHPLFSWVSLSSGILTEAQPRKSVRESSVASYEMPFTYRVLLVESSGQGIKQFNNVANDRHVFKSHV